MAQPNHAGGYRAHPEALRLARAAGNHAELLRALLDPADRPALARLDALAATLGELRRLLAGEP